MAFKTISLPDQPPRDTAQLKKKLPLHKGLGPWYAAGIFTLLAPFFPIIAMAMTGGLAIGGVGLAVFFFLGEGFAFFFLFTATRNYQRRLLAFSEGKKVKGKVIHRGKTFVFWKSARNYTITILFEIEGQPVHHRIVSNSPDLFLHYPVDGEAWGFYYAKSNQLAAPAELHLRLED